MNESTRPMTGARLAGRTVILTGAAGNLGSYISRYLLREGAKLVMTGRNGEKLERFRRELVQEGFAEEAMLVALGDSADPEACRQIVVTRQIFLPRRHDQPYYEDMYGLYRELTASVEPLFIARRNILAQHSSQAAEYVENL